MKNYTEPMFEVVTLDSEDVIRTSFASLFRGFLIERGGHTSLEEFETEAL